jgi:hypothetical protein
MVAGRVDGTKENVACQALGVVGPNAKRRCGNLACRGKTAEKVLIRDDTVQDWVAECKDALFRADNARRNAKQDVIDRGVSNTP